MPIDTEQALHALTPHLGRLSYSVRRHLVDSFHLRHTGAFAPGARILDMGGRKNSRRGHFNIDAFDLRVTYANIDRASGPDLLCDVAALPVRDGVFDGVLLSEVLEHVPDPVCVLREAHRALRPGGRLHATVPFLYHVHADPSDYGRYTAHYYRTHLTALGFRDIAIERHGGVFSVIASLIKHLANDLANHGRPRNLATRLLLQRTAIYLHRHANEWDAEVEALGLSEGEGGVLAGSTTGYGITCVKSA